MIPPEFRGVHCLLGVAMHKVRRAYHRDLREWWRFGRKDPATRLQQLQSSVRRLIPP